LRLSVDGFSQRDDCDHWILRQSRGVYLAKPEFFTIWSMKPLSSSFFTSLEHWSSGGFANRDLDLPLKKYDIH